MMADIFLISGAVFVLLWLIGVPMMDLAAQTLLLFCIPAAGVRLTPLVLRGIVRLIRRLLPLQPGDLRLGSTAKEPSVPVVLPARERDGHVALLGRTGTGKSTLMNTLIRQDLAARNKVILIDPHTALAQDMAHACVETGRMPALVTTGTPWMHSINLLGTGPHWSALDAARCVTDGLVRVYMPYQDELPMRMRHLVECAAYFLAAADEGYTLLEIPRFLRSRAFRAHLASRVQNRNGGEKDLASRIPMYSLSWLEDLSQTQFQEQVQSTWTRIQTLLSPPEAQRLVGCSRSTFTFEEILAGTPLLIGIGEEFLHRSAHLLNAMLTTWLTKRLLASRPPLGPSAPTYLYVDELAEISPESFDLLLRRARKETVRLTMIVQAQTMLDHWLYQTLMGNVGTLLIFGSSGPGVEELACEIARPARAELRDGSGLHLMELHRQMHEVASELRDLSQHHFLLYRAGSGLPAVRCYTELPQRVNYEVVQSAVELALTTLGRSVESINSEILIRQLDLDNRFGRIGEVGPGPGLPPTAPW
jgi:hypothetical protein